MQFCNGVSAHIHNWECIRYAEELGLDCVLVKISLIRRMNSPDPVALKDSENLGQRTACRQQI